jgi:hypothetical protein
MLRDLPPPLKTGAPAGTGANASNGAAPGAPAPTTGAPILSRHAIPSASAHLAAAAELCVDLARVVQADELPQLLERAATILDARGVVLWAADDSGAILRPSLAHGYPEKVLQRLRAIQVDADNVTSLAYRSQEPQALNGSAVTDPAALAIPLLAAGGCVGVMSVELRHNRPAADLLPVAKIIGAQFSTLIVPVPAPGERIAVQ